MAEDDLLGLGNIDLGGLAGQATDIGLTVLYTILFAIIVAIIGYYVWMSLRYKHKFRIVNITNNVPMIIDDTAAIVKDKGVEKWKLRKFKKYADTPPSEAISVTNRGRFSVEAEYSEDKGFNYYIRKNAPEGKESKIKERFAVNQKSFLVNQFRLSELEKPANIGQIIERAVPYVALVIIVVSIFVFWGEITKPAIEMQSQTAGMLKDIKEIKQIEAQRELKTQQPAAESMQSPEIPRPN